MNEEDTCIYCGLLSNKAKELHEESVTHNTLAIMECQNDLDAPDFLSKAQIADIKDDMEIYKGAIFNEDTNKYRCGNFYECSFSHDDSNTVIEHEKSCIFERIPIRKKEAIGYKLKKKSNAVAKCEDCGKTYFHTTKLHPKYALSRHKKTCSGDRGKVADGWWRDLTKVQKVELYEYFMNKTTS